jgi:histidinol-phosphatase (PHP family)
MTWANLHTHTWRCQHASGDVIDYARVARAGGMTVLGMSDHAPLPDGRWDDHRMAMAQLDDYIAAVNRTRQEVPEVRILLGLECDWDPGFAGFYADLRANRGFDYLIAGCHFTPFPGGEYEVPGARISAWIDTFNTCNTVARLQAYARHAEATMASGLFAFLTHPDLFAVANPRWTADTAACARDICAASVALGVPLELNSYGIRKPWVRGADGDRPGYPWPPFWEIAAASGAQVVLSSDAHRPQDVFAGYPELIALRDRLGLVEAELPWASARIAS